MASRWISKVHHNTGYWHNMVRYAWGEGTAGPGTTPAERRPPIIHIDKDDMNSSFPLGALFTCISFLYNHGRSVSIHKCALFQLISARVKAQVVRTDGERTQASQTSTNATLTLVCASSVRGGRPGQRGGVGGPKHPRTIQPGDSRPARWLRHRDSLPVLNTGNIHVLSSDTRADFSSTSSHAVVLHLRRPNAPNDHTTRLFYGELSEVPARRSAQGTCSADGGATLTISLLSSAKEGVRKVECEVMLPPRVHYPPKAGVSVTTLPTDRRLHRRHEKCWGNRRAIRLDVGATRKRGDGGCKEVGREGSRWHSWESGSAIAMRAAAAAAVTATRCPASAMQL